MRDHVDDVREAARGESDRGSETIEKVLWAVAVIGLVTIVGGALKIYVQNKSGEIK